MSNREKKRYIDSICLCNAMVSTGHNTGILNYSPNYFTTAIREMCLANLFLSSLYLVLDPFEEIPLPSCPSLRNTSHTHIF